MTSACVCWGSHDLSMCLLRVTWPQHVSAEGHMTLAYVSAEGQVGSACVSAECHMTSVCVC
jgi:hypothetical protein